MAKRHLLGNLKLDFLFLTLMTANTKDNMIPMVLDIMRTNKM